MSAPSIDSFSSDVLTIEVDGHVATLWLDRPEKRNAMGLAFWADLPVAMAALGADPDVRAVVLAAKGPHFSVGLDLTALADIAGGGGAGGDGPKPSVAARAARQRSEIIRLQASITAVADCPMPVIAAVQGWCIGGGVDLIAACDIRLASAEAQFSVREAKIAIVADVGSLQRLPAIIGKGHLAELAYTGKDISAERAASHRARQPRECRRRRRPGRRPGDGRRDRRQLAARRAGHQGGADRRRGPDRGRGTRVRGHLERGVPVVGRPGRGHGGLHREASGNFSGG